MKIVFVVFYYLFLGLTLAWGRYSKAGIGEMPLAYKSVFVQFLCNVAMLMFVGMSIYLGFTDIKLLLWLLVGGFVFGYKLIVPVIERILATVLKITTK